MFVSLCLNILQEIETPVACSSCGRESSEVGKDNLQQSVGGNGGGNLQQSVGGK